MKRHLVAFAIVPVIGAALALWLADEPAQAGLSSPSAAGGDPVARVAPAGNPAPEESHAFVGSKKCKMCHIKTHKSWAKTKMAKALDILKPGNAVEAKKKHGLDPNKDYTTDKTCLECHVTGFGKKGGYAIPDPANKRAVRKAKALAGVGCEMCHGPGKAYVKLFKEILKSKRKYKLEELTKLGLTKVGPKTCLRCHNEKSPTVDKSKKFDYEKEKDKGTHKHVKLKQRAG